MTAQYITTYLKVKEPSTFKKSRFPSRYPELDIELVDDEVFLTSEIVYVDVSKFIKDISRHLVDESWITISDVEEEKSLLYVFNSDSITTKQIPYESKELYDELDADDVSSFGSIEREDIDER